MLLDAAPGAGTMEEAEALDPDTLDSRDNLAVALAGLGAFAQAAELHRETLAIQERVLGSQHPRTLDSRDKLEAAEAALRQGTGPRMRRRLVRGRRAT